MVSLKRWLAAAACSIAGAGQAQTTATLHLGGVDVTAEVATDPAAQARGLTGHAPLGRNAGMLFPLQPARRVCLWMRDTEQALSAAFIDSAGEVIDTIELIPGDPTYRCASGLASYALELPAQWLSTHDVRPGDHVSGL